MNNQTGGVVLIFFGTVAVIMAVRGSWANVWAALSGKRAPAASNEAAFTFGPGGFVGTGGSGMPGSAPAPLAGGTYDALVRGPLAFAGVDQGIDFTGRGDILSPVRGTIARVQRSGSGWPGEGAFALERLDSGRYMYVAEDFVPTVHAGQVVQAGDVIGRATGSGRAPGIELGFASASGSPLSPLQPNPHSPKPWGYAFQTWIESLKLRYSQVQGSGVLA